MTTFCMYFSKNLKNLNWLISFDGNIKYWIWIETISASLDVYNTVKSRYWEGHSLRACTWDSSYDCFTAEASILVFRTSFNFSSLLPLLMRGSKLIRENDTFLPWYKTYIICKWVFESTTYVCTWMCSSVPVLQPWPFNIFSNFLYEDVFPYNLTKNWPPNGQKMVIWMNLEYYSVKFIWLV